MIPESTKRRKSSKNSTRGDGKDEVVDGSARETENRTKLRKPTSRKLTRAKDLGEKEVNPGVDSTTNDWDFRRSLQTCR